MKASRLESRVEPIVGNLASQAPRGIDLGLKQYATSHGRCWKGVEMGGTI